MRPINPVAYENEAINRQDSKQGGCLTDSGKFLEVGRYVLKQVQEKGMELIEELTDAILHLSAPGFFLKHYSPDIWDLVVQNATMPAATNYILQALVFFLLTTHFLFVKSMFEPKLLPRSN